MNALQVRAWPVEKLIPYARNARTHSAEQVAQIAASIAEFGFVNPVLIGPDNVIIAGHARLLAARKLGMTEVPVIVLDHLTETQRRALVLADNRLALNAGWDEEMLRVELASLEQDDFNLDALVPLIVPRLEDAEFYLTEDLKTPLPDRLESLKRVTFMESLGTLHDKTERIVQLVIWLGRQLGVPANERDIAVRAALLSKCDQVTLMVGDGKLAALQGIIGGHYAGLAGERPEVCQALAEQYLPVRPDDPVPATMAGKLLALADKVDNLAAAFSLGMIPRGTRDPQGLRRQAQAVLAILQAGDMHVPLGALVAESVGLVPEPDPLPQGALAPADAATALMDFVAGRIEATLQDAGLPYDTVRAALGGAWNDPVEIMQRTQALQRIREDAADFEAQVDTATRPANIWRNTDLPADVAVKPALFEHETEGAFWTAFTTARDRVEALQQAETTDYAAIWQAITALREPIEALFEAVMINADDPDLRHNRLAMMRELDTLYLRLADFREIVQ